MSKCKFLFSIMALILISSCSGKFRINPEDPAMDFASSLKNASPDFQKGWNDGCESGIVSGSNSFYQTFYKANKQDGYKMATSPEYRNAWDKAWWYCTHSVYIDQKSSVFSSLFSGYQ